MFRSVVRSTPRQILTPKLSFRPTNVQRFLSTAPQSQRLRRWKGITARWATAIGAVYFYNTSPMFADQPDVAISQLDEPLHSTQETRQPTLEAIIEEKRTRQLEEQAQNAKQEQPEENGESHGEGQTEDIEEDSDQQGAFNPETGEINWDCPCLGGMAHGPCGEEFKAAFSCFVYSKEEPKGMECIDKFKDMQDCFRQHPDMYGSELADDEDEVEDELRAEAAAKEAEQSAASASSAEITMPQALKSTPLVKAVEQEPAKDASTSHTRTGGGDSGEARELVPKSQHGPTLA